MRIILYFLAQTTTTSSDKTKSEQLKSHDWLFVADDDTILSIPRLRQLIDQLPADGRVILGERYGYGFGHEGTSGYDYPTGGAGMLFSRAAARELASSCRCPHPHSPDDMIIGLCAAQTSIPILHWEGFHQARPRDYSQLHLESRQRRHISFHRFTETDPYADYEDFLVHTIDAGYDEFEKVEL